MRRVLSALLTLGLLLTGVLFATAARSAPTDPGGPCYPPGTCHAQIFSSTTTPFQGDTIKVSGKFYLPNEDVRLTIGGIFVGTAHTDGDGAFDPPVVVPDLLGDQVLEGVGASGFDFDRDSLILNIRTRSGAGSDNGGLASTGVKIAAISLLGAALLIGGGFLVMAGRRRRGSDPA